MLRNKKNSNSASKHPRRSLRSSSSSKTSGLKGHVKTTSRLSTIIKSLQQLLLWWCRAFQRCVLWLVHSASHYNFSLQHNILSVSPLTVIRKAFPSTWGIQFSYCRSSSRSCSLECHSTSQRN